MVNPALFMHMHLTEYEQCMFVLSAVHLFIDKRFCLAVAKLSQANVLLAYMQILHALACRLMCLFFNTN